MRYLVSHKNTAQYRREKAGKRNLALIRVECGHVKASCQLRLGEAWQVTLHDDLLHGLREALRPENVKVVYG